tara:strand:- start:140858 stop:142555 length:1698 start_codon:yes stop_codon:yes gene_type:complete
MVENHADALRDAIFAAEHGADMVELRVDVFFEDRTTEPDDETSNETGESPVVDMLETRIDRVLDLVEVMPVACIVTCRPHWEGGEYHGDDLDRVALYEALAACEKPPAYIDVELATFTHTPAIRERIVKAVQSKGEGSPSTRLILSTHDFSGRPSDLTRKIIAMQEEDACSVVKIAYRARSIRDNLELFDILADRSKPTIALGMGEFGLMSRVLAPKFGGFLTFASLREEANTAPGQPTLDELLNLYRFRKIKSTTKVYGIIGWPVTQSMSPMVHNAGFEAIGFDGVYVPMPIAADPTDIEGSDASFKATVIQFLDEQRLHFSGASVTIPHKERAVTTIPKIDPPDYFDNVTRIGAANTITQGWSVNWPGGGATDGVYLENFDSESIQELFRSSLGDLAAKKIAVVGAGGAAKAAASGLMRVGAYVSVLNRTPSRAEQLVEQLMESSVDGYFGTIKAVDVSELAEQSADAYINCTPVGMKDGPDPDGLSIPIPDMDKLGPDTIFFDTVYSPIETPMIKAAKERGYRTIDGVEMFVRQAEMQFQHWTGKNAPAGLFDSLVRNKLST